ncbi:hypothetical protein EZV62_018958 [Acer yangbiense]|uniref:Uncharacterized protein n=1 Tax=Acer yangbiense TaxID=1000413 RepID=A0A5C7HB01_9ROSI|nr:hypothetical protein EZV62_018958 [Acer yangbiense]
MKMWYLVTLLSLSSLVNGGGVPQVPCYFIFGASLYDNGNNNAFVTAARANYPPYGIDFRRGPTGRFTNGRNPADIIAELLGFDNYIPPFASARGQDILKGVNYASGSSGIRDETGQHLGARISMNQQLLNHQSTISRIVSILGDNESASKLLSKCIYTVGIGNNDYIGNYFSRFYPTRSIYTIERYAEILIQQYSGQLKTLYNYGARKVALFGVPPLGCSPIIISMLGTNGSLCVDIVNKAIQLFNAGLIPLIDELNKNQQDAKFIYLNSYHITMTPTTGFKFTKTPCCEVGGNNTLMLCIPFRTSCQNRSDYMYWDAVHPTEAANVMVAGRSYVNLDPSDTYPIDIHRLAQL